MVKLTPKQQQIYDYILSFTAQHGYPPSVREIGAAVGLKSPSTVHFHMKGLEEAGVIVKAEGKTRAISIPAMPLGAVAEETDPRENQIPILGNVAAGAPILAEECIEDYLTFDTQGMSGEHFALRVRGRGSSPPAWPDRSAAGPGAGERNNSQLLLSRRIQKKSRMSFGSSFQAVIRRSAYHRCGPAPAAGAGSCPKSWCHTGPGQTPHRA